MNNKKELWKIAEELDNLYKKMKDEGLFDEANAVWSIADHAKSIYFLMKS